MGMFDRLYYEGIEYQTKEFECILEDLRIVKGRLLKDAWHYEEVPLEQRPYPNEKGLLGFCGCITKVIDKKDIDTNYHGVFEAHYIDDKKKLKSVFFKFADGNLISVEEQNEDLL